MEFSNELALGFYNKKLDAKADIDSPSLTGVPTAPTPEDDASSTQIATVEYVLAHGADNLMVASDDEIIEMLTNIYGFDLTA